MHKHDGLGKIDTCVGDLYKRCGKFDRYCVGEKWTNMVYRIGESNVNKKKQAI